jgi:DNA invertase Pin-like site-specific DNA recombinase
MKIGYARTSTVDQKGSLQTQRDRLTNEAGCEKVFSEQISGAAEERPQLEAALDYVREGDTLVVSKLDRFARSTFDLHRMIDRIHATGASLMVLDMGLDTSTSHGKMVVGIFGEVAEFERSLMKERQREGIERAKRQGKYQGRKPTARQKASEVQKLKAEGWPVAKIAREVGISRRSAHRILADQEGQGEAA